MMGRSYSSQGFVIARRNFGESDRIITVYSKDFGHVSLLAKGIRQPKSKKRSHLEIFSLIKFQAVVGNGLDIVTEVEIIDSFDLVRKSINKVSLAFYFCEVIGKITHHGEKNYELFYLIKTFLEKLKDTKRLKLLRLDFIGNLLVLLGYWPKNKILLNHDSYLEEVVERKISSARIGKIISS